MGPEMLICEMGIGRTEWHKNHEGTAKVPIDVRCWKKIEHLLIVAHFCRRGRRLSPRYASVNSTKKSGLCGCTSFGESAAKEEKQRAAKPSGKARRRTVRMLMGPELLICELGIGRTEWHKNPEVAAKVPIDV